MSPEKHDLLDRMVIFLKYHDIKSLMELVMEAINCVQEESNDKD